MEHIFYWPQVIINTVGSSNVDLFMKSMIVLPLYSFIPRLIFFLMLASSYISCSNDVGYVCEEFLVHTVKSKRCVCSIGEEEPRASESLCRERYNPQSQEGTVITPQGYIRHSHRYRHAWNRAVQVRQSYLFLLHTSRQEKKREWGGH